VKGMAKEQVKEILPNAKLHRYLCDYCNSPVIFAWTSKDGKRRYCKNACLEAGETLNENKETTMTDTETNEATETTDSSPATKTPKAAKHAKGKTAKTAKKAKVAAKSAKTAAKAAPAAKAKSAKSTANGVVDPFNVFRPGTAKAAMAKLMHDRKPHAKAELVAICEEYGTTSQVYDMLAGLKEAGAIKGHKIPERGVIQLVK